MNNLNEIYVAKKDKEYVLSKIECLCKKYNNRHAPDYKQQRTLFRNYCHDTIDVFNDCFETSMLGMIRCINKVERYQKLDGIEIDMATLDIVDMLMKLRAIVYSMVAIKDLPSCKGLIGLSPEDIISKAKNLVKSDIIKAGVGVILLGSKIHDVVKIEDVRSYYKDCLTQLNNEIETKREPISPIERFLLDKFNAEIGYCNLALFKAGISITEEVKGLIEIGKKHIEKYEHNYQISNDNVILSQI